MTAVKKHAILLLIISASMLVLLPPNVRADAPKPILSAGDMWKYSITSAPTLTGATAQGSFTGSLTQTVHDIEAVIVGGQTYDSYKLDISGSGTFTIFSGIAAGIYSFTLTGAFYRRVSDLADIRDTLDITISSGIISFTISGEGDVAPPLEYYRFPLSTGSSWTSSAHVTQTSTGPGVGGGSMTTTNSSDVVSMFNVERTERTTVQAGAFQSYVIKQDVTQTYQLGSTTFSQESYYSPQVGNLVKGTLQLGGSPFFNVELVDYTAYPYSSLVDISSSGKSYAVGLRTNLEATGIASNSTAITFNVDGVGTGKALVRIPSGLNNTAITVYEDAGVIASTSSKNGTEYDVRFNFALSQHRISIVYTKPPSGLAFVIGLLTNPYSILGFIIVAASVAAVAAVLEHRRRRPTAPPPHPSETGPGADGSPSPPAPLPPTESPAPPQSTNN
ncbi:MAG: hypothetical protein AUF79_13940 [Crenarchaeota archaeon 13_1_20CM_2_51_8]|nr:MAG: hypothetical protein AUF79_13940 [Crenarchaeota archaeon 13_1_20CM_2_51_8]